MIQSCAFHILLFSLGFSILFAEKKDEYFNAGSVLLNRESEMRNSTYTYLALGDSYTIGESVPVTESFPYQTVQMLRNSGYDFQAPEIIARTGWTTDELQAAINKYTFRPSYDFVTLLIGVNNQYRGRSASEYEEEFDSLLRQSVRFAGGKSGHVIVLSVPDWGVTPFAEGRDRQKIRNEIDEFNRINKNIAVKNGVHYINITPGTREAKDDKTLLAADKLHPSAREYERWAKKISTFISNTLAQ